MKTNEQIVKDIVKTNKVMEEFLTHVLDIVNFDDESYSTAFANLQEDCLSILELHARVDNIKDCANCGKYHVDIPKTYA